MRSGLNLNQTDAVLIRNFIANPENTMKQIVSNSVGMTILSLKETYFGDEGTQRNRG
jgi:hypothetical protein